MIDVSATSSVFAVLGMSPETWERTRRAGAIAGRGFHFQDAVLTWLAVQGVVGAWPVELVIPEGRDDGTLSVGGAVFDVQIKSRQPHLGAVPPSEVGGWVSDLAGRRASGDETGPVRPRLMLVVEHGVPQTGRDRVAAEVPAAGDLLLDGIGGRMSQSDAKALLDRLHIVAVADPLDTAASMLADARDLNPAAARLAVQSIAAATAECQDHNAITGVSPASLARTDIEGIIAASIELVDFDGLEQALRLGLCESVDFTRADPDERYLLGVSTTPAHVAAGVVFDRPERVAEVSEALDARRRVLVAGPSGVGKSAVVWLTVYATRHRVRWYRVRNLLGDDAVAVVDRLVRSLQASEANPVGLVVDDLGRMGVAKWDALVSELTHRPGVLLLGAVREQDLADVRSQPLTDVVRPRLDETLAEDLWTALRARGATDWPGWKEPFANADGLALEYTTLLTRGGRLEAILDSQLKGLAAEGAGNELAVLSVVAVGDLMGVSLSVTEIARTLGLDEQAVRSGTRRLREEFLVRSDGESVRGLHELRSYFAADIVEDVTLRNRDTTVAAVLGVVDTDSLDLVLRRAGRLAGGEIVVRAVSTRLIGSRSGMDLAAILRGLRLMDLDNSAAEVAERLASNLPAGEIARTIQTRFGASLHDSIVIDIEAQGLVTEPSMDLRSVFAAELDLDDLTGLEGITDARALAEVLVGLDGVYDISRLTNFVSSIASQLTGTLAGFIALLDAARLVGPELHGKLVDAVGGPQITLAAVAANRGFALTPVEVRSPEPTIDLAVDRNAPFWRAGSSDGDLVASLLAALPEIEKLSIVPVDELGRELPALDWGAPRPSGVSAPPVAKRALDGEWRGALLAAVGLPRWSTRLAEELELLPQLATALRMYAETLSVGRSPTSALVGRFERLDQLGRALPPAPFVESEPARKIDGPVGAADEADPVVTLFRDPRRLLLEASDARGASITAFRLWRIACDLRAARRWSLVDDDNGEGAIDRIIELLHAIRTLEAERAANRHTPIGVVRLAKPERRLELAVGMARESASSRLARTQRRFAARITTAGFQSEMQIVGSDDEGPAAVWPPGRIVTTIDLASAQEWPDAVARLLEARQDEVDQPRAVTAIFRLPNGISACLSGEAMRAWWPRTDAPAAVGLTAATESLGDAWRRALSTAACLRAARQTLRIAAANPGNAALRAAITVAGNIVEHGAAEARAALVGHDILDVDGLIDAVASIGSPDARLQRRIDDVTLQLADAESTMST